MAKLKLAAQEKLQLVLESLKSDVNASVLCRQHDIWPTQLNCLKQKALKGALEALSSRNGKKDAEKEALKSELQHLKEVIAS